MNNRRKASVEGPTDVSLILGALLQSPMVKGAMEDAILVQRWPEVVGESVAQHVILKDFQNGILQVHCPSSTWRSEVNFAKKAILEQSNRLLGKPIAKDIRFV